MGRCYIVTCEETGQPKAYLKVSQHNGSWQWTENPDDAWVFYARERKKAHAKAKEYRGKVDEVEG